MTFMLAPSYHGYILSNEDALLVIEACLSGRFPLVHRRPLDAERPELIRLGNVFVFVEESSEIKRWTDGISWSALRILGRFLIYRELDKMGLAGKDDKRKGKLAKGRKGSRDSALTNDLYSHYDNTDSRAGPEFANAQPPTIPVAGDRGLLKKALSLTIPASESSNGMTQTIHLISYFSAYDVLAGNLLRPTRSALQQLRISSSLWLAIKRLSLGGKSLIEHDANFYLDSNYQLQDMTFLALSEGLSQTEIDPQTQQTRSANSSPPLTLALPSAYTADTFKFSPTAQHSAGAIAPQAVPVFLQMAPPRAPMSAPVDPMTAPMTAPMHASMNAMHAPLSAPVGAPMSHPYGVDPAYYTLAPQSVSMMEALYTRVPYHDEPSRKRARSFDSEPQYQHYSSMDALSSEDSPEGDADADSFAAESDHMHSYVPQPLPASVGGGLVPEFNWPMAQIPSAPVWDKPTYGPEMFRNSFTARAHTPMADHIVPGHDQYSYAGLPLGISNRAFSVQVSQQPLAVPVTYGTTPYGFMAQRKWEGISSISPMGMMPRRDPRADEEQEVYH